MTLSFNFFNWLPLSVMSVNELKPKYKTHNYSKFIPGEDYVFEWLNYGLEGRMTGIGQGIQPCDYIILRCGSELLRCQVAEIDYYADPPDMWMASLKKVIDNA
ncbi:hypothetical protein H6G74_14895 [Nostoc spongiaeforme FACHB-130]|uniref:Uncharacterized protein n=2 Tax=Nostoc TaxID=1177 RepID=A0ABR8FWY6_9NOSO|nr:hypothetical protein [Nostoc spongiaeforme FACHB-130]